MPAGVAAAAAAVLVGVILLRPDWGEQLTATPVIGGWIQTFLGGTVKEEPGEGADLEQPPVRVVAVDRRTEALGVVLQVDLVELHQDHTRVEYRLQGEPFRLEGAVDLTWLQPSLIGPHGPVPFRSSTAQRRGDIYLLNAFFDPVPEADSLTFRIDRLPLRTAGGPGWKVGTERLERAETSFQGGTVRIVAWSQQGETALIRLEWADAAIVRFSDWQAVGADGRRYLVQEGASVAAGDRLTQTLRAEVPAGGAVTLEAGAHDRVTQGPWVVTFQSR
jgi:hypothetical protein